MRKNGGEDVQGSKNAGIENNETDETTDEETNRDADISALRPSSPTKSPT